MMQSGAPDAAGASAAGAALKEPGQAQAGRNSAAVQARLASAPATEVRCHPPCGAASCRMPRLPCAQVTAPRLPEHCTGPGLPACRARVLVISAG